MANAEMKNLYIVMANDPNVVVSRNKRRDLKREEEDYDNWIKDLCSDLPPVLRHKVIVNLLSFGINTSEEIDPQLGL